MKRRGNLAITVGLAVLAGIFAIMIVTALIRAIAQTRLGRLAAWWYGLNGSGSYETTALLDGLPIETSGKVGIESHLSLTGTGTDMTAHFAATQPERFFSSQPKLLNQIRSRAFDIIPNAPAYFIDVLPGKQIPPDAEVWYSNQRWCSKAGCFQGKAVGKIADYALKKVVVKNPKNNREVVTAALDWGPRANTGRVAGISPETSAYLDADTDDVLIYGWAKDQSIPLGPATNVATTGGGSGLTTDVGDGLQQTARGFPRYMQYKGPWAGNIYGKACSDQPTVSSSGCGPSSLANVMLFYQKAGRAQPTSLYRQEFGNAVTPGTVAALSDRNGFRVCGQGTSAGMFNSIGRRYLNLRAELASWDAVIAALKQKTPVIASMGAGYFTSGGHFVTLYDISPNGGTIYVSDSYVRNRTEAPISTVRGQGKYFYVISPL